MTRRTTLRDRTEDLQSHNQEANSAFQGVSSEEVQNESRPLPTGSPVDQLIAELRRAGASTHIPHYAALFKNAAHVLAAFNNPIDIGEAVMAARWPK